MPTFTPNPFNPLCMVNQCLQQVIGTVNSNPAAQYSACVSMFGSPVVSTVIPPIETILSTSTTTVPYTDIVVSLSTTYSTDYETVTSLSQVYETATEYSSTSTATTTTTAVNIIGKRSSNKKTRRSCKPQTTSLTAPYPIATNCPSLEEYQSACSCIYAVSSTSTVTETAATATSVVPETATSTLFSTTTSVATILETNTVTTPATTTLTSTTTELALTTQTSTTTTNICLGGTCPPPPQPTVNSRLVIANGPRAGRFLTSVSNYVQFGDQPAAVNFTIPSPSGQISIVGSNPPVKMYTTQTSTLVGVLYLETEAAAAAANDQAVICATDSSTGLVSCTVPSRGLTNIYSCGPYFFAATPAWQQAGCTLVNFRTA